MEETISRNLFDNYRIKSVEGDQTEIDNVLDQIRRLPVIFVRFNEDVLVLKSLNDAQRLEGRVKLSSVFDQRLIISFVYNAWILGVIIDPLERGEALAARDHVQPPPSDPLERVESLAARDHVPPPAEQTDEIRRSRRCRACRLFRTPCTNHCQYFPYFRVDLMTESDINSLRDVYGPKNLRSLVQKVRLDDRAEAIKSLLSDARKRMEQPAKGCTGEIEELKAKLAVYETNGQASGVASEPSAVCETDLFTDEEWGALLESVGPTVDDGFHQLEQGGEGSLITNEQPLTLEDYYITNTNEQPLQ